MYIVSLHYTFNDHRYTYTDDDGATTWAIGPDDLVSDHDFTELYLLGGANLAFKAVDNDEDAVSAEIGYVHGDKSGVLHVGFNQNFNINDTDADVPFSIQVYETAELTLPARTFFWKTYLNTYSLVSTNGFYCQYGHSLPRSSLSCVVFAAAGD